MASPECTPAGEVRRAAPHHACTCVLHVLRNGKVEDLSVERDGILRTIAAAVSHPRRRGAVAAPSQSPWRW